MNTRTGHDSLGDVEIPAAALYGPQTQRAVDNFQISPHRMPAEFIEALGLIKAVAARVNASLELLDSERALAIEAAAEEVARNEHDDQFPIDVFQTGSGTSSNMNANEVIATLAARAGGSIHPNDHVNLGQSSNDVIPTAIHVSASLLAERHLFPALEALRATLAARAGEFDSVVKTGRTHLMDALPITLGQEISGWHAQVESATRRLRDAETGLHDLAIGGTAVGTGLNTHPDFGHRVAGQLAARTGVPFRTAPNRFAAIAGQDAALHFSAQLRGLAVVLLKIANDLRWMNSGPTAGLAEINLPALQPGSSIMPGKVNPVIPEAVAMSAVHVIGNDAAMVYAASAGSFELNTMLPLIAWTLLTSTRILANASAALDRKALAGFTVNRDHVESLAARNPVLGTALATKIGYEATARIVQEAVRTGRAILEVAREQTSIDPEELGALLDPRTMI